MQTLKAKLTAWLESHTSSPHARVWLWVIAFTETTLSPIPPDPFLALIVLKQPNKWLQYSLEVTIASTLGALLGYAIGFLFYESLGKALIEFYHLTPQFTQITEVFDTHVFWAMFVAVFTPVPDKIFTVAGGVAQVNIVFFIIATFLGRGLRSCIVALAAKKFGPQLWNTFLRFFNIISIIIVVLIAVYVLIKFVF